MKITKRTIEIGAGLGIMMEGRSGDKQDNYYRGIQNHFIISTSV